MKVDRGEAQGTGLALLLHLALVAALTVNLAQAPALPEPPSMTVEFVDSEDIALTAAAPAPVSPSAALSPSPTEPAPPAPAPALAPPLPLATPAPSPLARAVPAARPAPSRAAPPRQSRLGDDFLADLPDAPAAARSPAQGAATFSAAAKASIDGAIKRQIQPCADRQPALGPGADRIRVAINLRLDRSGRLSRPPALVRTSGVDEDNARFEDLAFDQAVAVFRACTPLRLPPELYSTPQGGWSNITMTYRAK